MGIHSYLPATITHFGLLDPENEGTVMLWNGGNYLPIAMVQQPSRLNLQEQHCFHKHNKITVSMIKESPSEHLDETSICASWV